jgi:hypothetical protein
MATVSARALIGASLLSDHTWQLVYAVQRVPALVSSARLQAKLGRGEERKEPVVTDEGRHCMEHGRTHLAYRWYVREKRSSEPEVFVIRGSAPRVDYLCNAAYSRLPQAEKAEWRLLE